MNQKTLLVCTAIILVAVLAIALILYNNQDYSAQMGVAGNASTDGTGETQENSDPAAPDFYFFDESGNRQRLSQFKGKPVILNFWASWCGPCKSEMPDLEEAYKKYGEEIQFVVMVWGLSWHSMTLGTANVLAVTSALIQNSVMRANRYLKVLEEKRYQSATGALEESEFDNLLSVYQKAKAKGLTEFTVLEVMCNSVNKTVVDNVYRSLRKTDYVGITKNGELYILLPNTKAENAKIVMDRIQTCGYKSQIVGD